MMIAAAVAACGGDFAKSSGALTAPSPVVAPSAAAADVASVRFSSSAVTSGADLQMSGSASTGSPDAGAVLTYTFQVKNSGPDDAAAVTVTDALPAGTQYLAATVPAWSGLGGPIGCNAANNGTSTTVTCGLGSMVKGGQATIVISVNAPATAGTFANTATASSTTVDPNPPNNAVTVSAQVKTALNAACTLPAGQTSLHGLVMWITYIDTPSGRLPTDFAFMADNGVEYYVKTNFYDGAAPLTTVINLDCKQSPVQFIAVGGFVMVTGTFGTDTVQAMPTLNASVVQVPTHKDKI